MSQEKSPPPGSPRKPKKIIPIAADNTTSFYEARKKIHPRSISGLFANWRWAMVWITQLVFYGLPWLQWGGRQMVLFDLEAMRFYLFGLVLYPQDFIFLAVLLIICALALFLFTTVAGRLWCGFSCPQTVYTEIFMWLEKVTEGDRSARLRLDHSGWTLEKILKRGAKHASWLAVSLWTGFTFVGYFVPIRTLAVEVMALQGAWQIFWLLFYSLATYGNAGFLREQICKHMCPYARFQSAMLDKDTLIVTYDQLRGEPRGARSKKQAADAAAQLQGDCIDCTLCVQVCPVGIDIRNGLQYECIGCGLCVDACDSVMDKVGSPRGLIRFATQNGMQQRWSKAQMLRRVLRPRVLVYTAIMALFCIALAASMTLRVPLKVNVVRDRATLARLAPGGQLENLYRLQIMNATEQPQRYRISASGLEGVSVVPEDSTLELAPTESRWVTVRARIPYGSATPGAHTMQFIVQAQGSDGIEVLEPTVFQVPR